MKTGKILRTTIVQSILILRKGLFFFVALLCVQQIRAQTHAKTDSSAEHKQVDITDLYRKVMRKHHTSAHDSAVLQQGKVYLAFIPAIGYTVQTSFTAVATVNLSFYTDDPATANISTIYGSANFSLLHQVVIPVITSIWTKNNEFNFLGDYRYYKYPSITYGLGGHSNGAEPDPIDFSYFRFYQVVAREVRPDLLLGLGYNLDYHYNIKDFGIADGTVSDFQKYGYKSTSVSSGVSFNVLYDTRRNSNNPQRGWYADIAFRPNLKVLGSDDNWQSLYTEFRKYIRFPQNSHNVLAFWNFNWFTFGKAPYLDLPATAWETFANSSRGYVQDRLKGADMLYFETEYRFRILANGFLGGVVFANAQSVSNWPVQNFDTVYPAVGAGLRIKINKFSNTNACIDYGIGLNGSRAFYLNLGEVF